MTGKDAFSSCHPLVNFLYFAWILIFTMFFTHPLSLAVSLFSAIAYEVCLNGKETLRRSLRLVLPTMLLTAAVGIAFNHEGATILTYLPGGNPLTLESILCSLASAALLAAVILWFSCYTAVMSSDKFIWLFGRIIPALSLVLSMTLRFVPEFRRQLAAIQEAQRSIGRDVSSGSLWQRTKKNVTVLSVLITRSLENAIETADSMRARGWGLPGRTAFSIYRLDGRDRALLLWLCFCGLYISAGWCAGSLDWRWYPTVKGAAAGAFPVSLQAVYLALCLTPVFLDKTEDRKWKSLQ